MAKFGLFALLWWLLGNPFLALIVLLVVLYALDRRFIGLSPNLLRPLRRRREIGKRKRILLLNPHDVSAKLELARLLNEGRQYGQAKETLLGIGGQMADSAEYWSDLGTCELALGDVEAGERHMLQALAISPRVKFGQPYLRLAETFSRRDADKAIGYLQQFKTVNSSSCEAYYRLGTIYSSLNRPEEAAQAYRECRQLYRALPKYMKRHERKWALRSLWRGR